MLDSRSEEGDQANGLGLGWVLCGGLAALRAHGLTADDILVLQVLLAHHKPDLRHVRVSQGVIARLLGRDIANVRKSIKRLSELGLLKSNTKGGGAGRITSYNLTRPLAVLENVTSLPEREVNSPIGAPAGAQARTQRISEIKKRRMDYQERLAEQEAAEMGRSTGAHILKAAIGALDWVLSGPPPRRRLRRSAQRRPGPGERMR
jgi:hypothetical protein